MAATKPTTHVAPQEPSVATTQPAGEVDYGAESHRIVSQADEIVSVLENGATVIVKRVSSPVVAVRAYAGTGGAFEGRWLGGGLSHLLEHLVAGGSDARRTEQQNIELLAEIGNNSNAYTTYDHTAFFVNTTVPHMEQAVDLVTGWVLGAKITPAEYRREYEVVQRELEKGKGEPDQQFDELAQMNRYRETTARVPVIGYQEVIQGLSRDDVYEYYKLAYQPGNLVFAVTGDIEPAKMLQTVQRYVREAKPGRVFLHDVPPEPPVTSPRTIVATFPKLGQAKLRLGFPTIPLQHPDLYALDLLATVLTGGESSLLIEELRDKQQLVQAIGAASDTPSFIDGTFDIDMELDTDKIEAATKAALDQIEKLKTEPIDASRIERAKAQMRTSRVRSLQGSEQIASSLATDFLATGDPHFSDRYVERIGKVTADQLQAVAKKYLDRNRLITTALVPAEAVGSGGLPKAEDLLRAAAPTTKPTTAPSKSVVTRVEMENGTVLLHKRIATSPLVSIQFFSLGGMTAEDAKTNGIGNLTMEMLPRGTTTRSASQIAQFFDSIGGEFNTGCGNNTWFWNASCLKEDFAKTMEVYADVVNHPSFPEAELGPIKQRTLGAIESIDSDWTNQAMRYFKKVYFGPLNSPYQFMTIGTKETVPTFTPEQLKSWYTQKILPSKRVIAIYGDVDLKDAQTLATQYFGGGPQASSASPAIHGRATAPSTAPSIPSVDVRAVEVQKTEQPLAGVVIGYDSNSTIQSPDRFPLAVGDTMTSGYGYPTGYLHEILRGRGLVYVVHAQDMPGRSKEVPGAFFVYAGCDPKNVNEVVDVILENIARLQGSPKDVQVDWFERSKKLIDTTEAMSNETPADQATTAALDEIYGLGYDFHDHFAEHVDRVTLDEVRDVAKRLLHRCVITVSTPAPELVNRKTGVREYRTFPPVDLTPRGVQHDTK
jgi:zinc protease